MLLVNGGISFTYNTRTFGSTHSILVMCYLTHIYMYVGMYVSFTYNTLGLSKHFVGVKSNFPSMIGDDDCCVCL